MEAKKRFWVSWWADLKVNFELHSPWWRSGYRDVDVPGDSAHPQDSLCAAVEAADEEDAKRKVIAAHDAPVELEWRFVEARPDDWSPFCDRFQKAEWMQWPAS